MKTKAEQYLGILRFYHQSMVSNSKDNNQFPLEKQLILLRQADDLYNSLNRDEKQSIRNSGRSIFFEKPKFVDRDVREVYMVHVDSGSVYVRDIDFFRSQGGFRESWGVNWFPIIARNIDEAQAKGLELLDTLPRSQQEKL